jgi:outer membrane receptor protein involved in Fe transport
MNNLPQSLVSGLRIPLVATAFTLGAGGLSAQDEDDTQVVELSPFVVEGEDTDQYQSTSTLAGTRIKTDLADIGASITAVSSVFLEDTNSTDLNDLLPYIANTESAGQNGNFSASNDASGTFSLGFRDGGTFVVRPQQAQRVRGLDAADSARDLFRSTIEWDAYNVTQVDVVRGANSILFGQGSPAGIINVNLIKPLFKNSHEVQFRFDDNDSIRASFDSNVVIIEDKLAVRLAGLSDNRNFRQQPTYEDDERLFATARWNITDNLSIRANGEWGSIDANRPSPMAPIDGITEYLELLGITTDPKPRLGRVHGDPWVEYPAEGQRPSVGSVQAVFVPNIFLQWGNQFELDGSLSGTHPGETSFTTILNATAIRPNNGVLDRANYRYWFSKAKHEYWLGKGPGIRATSFDDYSIFDWKNNYLSGNFAYQDKNFNTHQFAVEFISDEGNFGIELAHDYQESDYEWARGPDGANGVVRLDVSEFRVDGTPNPNLLRPVVPITVGMSPRQTEFIQNETTQFTAFGKFDFSEDGGVDGLLGEVLGDHTLTLFASLNEVATQGQRSANSWDGENVRRNASNPLNADIPLGHNHRGVSGLIYLGPSVTGINDINISPVNFSYRDIYQNGSTYQMRIWDKAAQNFIDYPMSIVRYLSAVTDESVETETLAAVLQSKLFSDHIVTTVGYRKDDLTDRRYVFDLVPGTQVVDPESFDVDEQVGSGEYLSWSVVAKSPRNWDLPLNTRLNVFYSESENFDPSATGRLNALGNPIDPPTGTTKDYGIRINTSNNKFSLRFNLFETASTLNSYTGGNLLNAVIDFDVRFRALSWIPGVEQGFINPNDPAIDAYGAPPAGTLDAMNASLLPDETYTFDNVGTTRLNDTADVSADGFEVEVVYNPNRNLRLMLNASKQETVRTNSVPGIQAYIEERIPEWEAIFAYPNNIVALNDNNTFRGPDGFLDTSQYVLGAPGYGVSMAAKFQNQIMVPLNQILDEDGTVISEQRKWRFNAIANYTFNQDSMLLNGFGIGAAIRWQDQSAIGFPIYEDADGNPRQDVHNPYYGEETTNVDGWISYSRKILNDQVDWRIQLNVRNLFSDDSPIPVTIDGFGAVAQYRMPSLTTWSIANTFRF